MLDWSQCPTVERVPVSALFENLEDGATVGLFLEWFPGGTRQQVKSVLDFANQCLAVEETAL